MNKHWPLVCRRALVRLLCVWMLFHTLVVSGQPLSWTQHPGYRESELQVPAAGRTGFTLLAPDATGILFTNSVSYSRSEANQNLLNGCGVAAGDFNGDGLCDLYFANSEGANGLFQNLGGWKFSNITAAAGVACSNQASKGVVFADIDGDGRLDLLVNALGGPNACFLNLGNGRFTNVTAAAGIAGKAGGHSLALADVDGDGDLDLYMANYGELSILRSGGQFSVRTVNGRQTVTGRWAKRLRLVNNRLIELGEPDVLYLNDGKGKFTAEPWTGGTFLNADGMPLKSEPWDMGLSVMFRDINGDGAPDIYVCNDFQTPDRIWINDGRGHFRALADLAVRSLPHFSMGVDFADIDRDGLDDFFVGDMLSPRHDLKVRQVGAANPPADEVGETWDRNQIHRNTLNLNRGDGTYAEIANFAGLDATDWTWSVAFLDVDLDGFEDLLAVNAHAYDTQDLDMQERAPAAAGGGGNRQIGKSLKDFPPLITPNYAFRNRGNRTFAETGAPWGFHSTNVSHGIALGDLDNDGDLDVVVSCLWQPPLLYRNESTAPRVAVRLKGVAPNTHGIGARIRLLGGAVPQQAQEIQSGGRYLSSDEAMRVFAVGKTSGRMSLEVRWRSGKTSVIEGVRANHIYEIDEAGAQPARPKQAPVPQPQRLFRDVSAALSHSHAVAPYNDAERQPLLSKSFARLGPGVAWADLDGDGSDELIVGGDAGNALGLFRFDPIGSGQWRSVGMAIKLPGDTAGLVGWSTGPNQSGLLLAQESLRPGHENANSLLRLVITGSGAQGRPILEPAGALKIPGASAGPVAVADIDGDGDLDLFVGGRMVPGRYPEAAASMIFINDGGRLVPDARNNALLAHAGLVSGALFSDLYGDGSPELILACEWGPIRVFENKKGQLKEITAQLGLDSLTGWWNGVSTADVDGDGRLDIIASNWGWNSSSHRPSREAPARLYYGDFDDNGTMDLIDAEEQGGRWWPRRNLVQLSEGLPGLRIRFPTHKAFSQADIPALLDRKYSKAAKLEATTLASTLFLNRGDRFEARQLPDEAQYAPAFAVNVADFDGDGHEDLFLSQNFFGMRMEEPRLDGGRGLCLRGDGRGGFAVMPGLESGVMIYGEQRGAALGDFDRDGRVDLVVTQPGGETKLFHNEAARPGLRVRLAGVPGNPQGIGAQLRLKFGSEWGPLREVHGGSGYWSQDSVMPILATPREPTELEVRWPGGQLRTSALPPGSKEVRVRVEGTLERLR